MSGVVAMNVCKETLGDEGRVHCPDRGDGSRVSSCYHYKSTTFCIFNFLHTHYASINLFKEIKQLMLGHRFVLCQPG